MDKFTQIICHEYGKTYRWAMPRLVLARTIAYNMQMRVIDYFREVAEDKEINYIVDVGACFGGFAVPYTVMFPEADILCIEPSKENFPFLQFNTKDLSQIKNIKMAAHNKKADVRIAAPTSLQRKEPDHDIDTGLISVYGRSNKYSETVRADTLDNIVKRKVDWLKIDVEGNELAVLEGSERILTQDRPILQVEIRDENQKMAEKSASRLILAIAQIGYGVRGSIMADMLFLPNVR